MTETAAAPPPPTTNEPLFVRPREGRVLAGVCAGIAGRWAIDLTVVRIAAIILTALSGVGVIAYVGLWLLTPSVDGPAVLRAGGPVSASIARHGPRWARVGRILLVVVAIAVAVSLVGHLFWWRHPWIGNPWAGVPVGLLAIVVLIGLAVSTRWGRWAILGAVALILAGLTGFGLFGASFGTRTFAVANATNLSSSYDAAAGTVNLDLSQIDSVSGHRRTTIDLGSGNVNITVPQTVPVLVEARAGVGTVTIAGRVDSGIDAAQTRMLGAVNSGARDELIVDVTVGAGSISVN